MASELAVLAGGCFWGVEDLIRRLPGVLDTEVGYTGGRTDRPTYREVCRGDTGHAEAISVRFDPAVLSYSDLLRYFFRIHDPTTLHRQGGDIGSQYRSALFPQTPEQTANAKLVIDEINQSGFWPRPIVTTIEPAAPFFAAEAEHQDYLVRNPGGYSCHWERPAKK
jgi:methionine-S-sulfoxide reductase